jgi:hypothetical protein
MSVKIPSHFDLGFDVDLNLPTSYSIDLDIDPMTFTINPIELKPIEIKPLEMVFRLKEVPSIRAHLPVDYKVGFSVLGAELFCIHLCGQGQVITEPYVANPCECKG